MNIIIPMAGMGKRLRPHTLNTPKPLIRIAGKPIVQWLVEDIIRIVDEKIDNIGFIVGSFGDEVERELVGLAEGLGIKGHIFYQNEPLGTAHAIYCAEPIIHGKVIVAFADTIFNADFKISDSIDGLIWVKKVDDPSAFGVVKLNESNYITDFIEKPVEYVSDQAIIGIYYFKDGNKLNKELKGLMDNKVMKNGEYQLTTVLENLKNEGYKFGSGVVKNWLDFGNPEACIKSMEELMGYKSFDVNEKYKKDNVIVKPCYIGKNVTISNSIIGPYVTLDDNSHVTGCILNKSIIGRNAILNNSNLSESMAGDYCEINGYKGKLNLGAYSVV